jgi:putative cardiolipin synthase
VQLRAPSAPGHELTRLSRWIEPRCAANGNRSGFRLLHTGLDAFVARGLLIELADRSLDLQYYICHTDTTGSIIVDRLIAAADRGVRVRLLLDDWGTADKKDEAVAGLDAHPNIEIRLFNPYVHRSGVGKLAEMLTSFARVNRRMHNKQLIADDQAVVLGGRNIGDEYFGLGEVDFQDVDVLGGGPIAGESSASFEAYWNSAFAVPISQLGKYTISATALAAARQALHERVKGLWHSPYAQALRDSEFATAFRAHDLQLHWAGATLLADPPDKLTKPAGTRSASYLGAQFTPYADAVRSDLLVVSPYFVPGKRGVTFFGGKSHAGVTVRILTNSLAATDVWLVHAGYRKYRRPLLEQGVRLYELKPEAQGAAGVKGLVGSSRASLHGKTFVLDRTSVFVGSVNIDPRSLSQNTEVGVLVHSAGLAREVAELFDRWVAPELSYEVRLARPARRPHLQWVGAQNGQPERFTHEPHAGLGRRLGASLFSWLPIESLI